MQYTSPDHSSQQKLQASNLRQ